MSTVTIFTMDYCPYCERAKALLKNRGVAFKEVRVPDDDDAQWDALYKKSGMRTMPQIFSGDELIGGFTELSERDQKDQLASLK
jgi:glutaredoxin 3